MRGVGIKYLSFALEESYLLSNTRQGSDCNVGFWVRHKDEWDWLRSLLSVEDIKGLLADEYQGKPIVSRLLWTAPRLDALYTNGFAKGSIRAPECPRRAFPSA
jgi:hypothetical protein